MTNRKVIRLPQSQQKEDSEETKDLTHFDKARQQLQLATRIDEVKSIRDKAAAIQAYLKQSGESLEIQNMAAEIKIRAERRAGEILSKMDLHQGGRPSNNHSHDEIGFPRLRDLDIDRNMSSRCQLIASIPQKEFDERVEELKGKGQELTSKEFLSLAGYLQREGQRQQRREAAAEAAAATEPDERMILRHGDFREMLTDIPDASANLLLTDPLYGREHLPLWKVLAEFASRILKPGRLLVTYSGQQYLPEVLRILTEHLDYVWTVAVKYSYPDNAFKPRIKTYWKPVLILSNGEYEPKQERFWLHDFIERDGKFSTLNRHHPYEQGLAESLYLLESLTYENDLVVDPFLGSGTTAVAAKRMNRRFVGCDVDDHCVNEAKRRLSQESHYQE